MLEIGIARAKDTRKNNPYFITPIQLGIRVRWVKILVRVLYDIFFEFFRELELQTSSFWNEKIKPQKRGRKLFQNYMDRRRRPFFYISGNHRCTNLFLVYFKRLLIANGILFCNVKVQNLSHIYKYWKIDRFPKLNWHIWYAWKTWLFCILLNWKSTEYRY